jgi:hypothetical protein
MKRKPNCAAGLYRKPVVCAGALCHGDGDWEPCQHLQECWPGHPACPRPEPAPPPEPPGPDATDCTCCDPAWPHCECGCVVSCPFHAC